MSKSPIVQRKIAKEVAIALTQYPFVSITGPRQSGKTTLCHLVASEYEYVNLEMDEYKTLAERDPRGFIKKYPYKVILDEVQNVPNLFRYLMHHTDKMGKNGAYILSGSQNFLLMEKISQSLAGRVAVFSLLPFSLKEISAYLLKRERSWQYLAFKGAYPRIFKEKKMNVSLFYNSYIKTYVERDIRKLQNIHNSKSFLQFVKLLALRIGNIFNAAEIGAQIGVDGKTIQRWLSTLEASYITYTVPAYYNNFDKRVIKKPKLYFYDTGIACALLGIKTADQISNFKYAGALFENFVINEHLKAHLNNAQQPEFYFWQDSNGNEVDLIIDSAKHLELIEIKSGSTPNADFSTNLQKLTKLMQATGIKTKATVLYGGSDGGFTMNKVQYSDWESLLI